MAGEGGLSRGYSLIAGWGLPYPETTGYTIPTFLAFDQRFPDLQLGDRAWRAGRWLAAVQFESGAICSRQYRPDNTTPSVFNTGMVLHGWVSLLEHRKDDQICSAAARAAHWLIGEQEDDGSWTRNAYGGIAHSYYTMVAWALARYGVLRDDASAQEAARRNLEWTLSQQRENGWFDRCWFHQGDPVSTHTLSYTTQGLVESGRLLGEPRFVESARRGSVAFRDAFVASGKLAGTFSESWQPTARWECCTGNAQTSLVWQALAAATGDGSWQASASALNTCMRRYQKVRGTLAGIDGAIPGSWPISGDYDRFDFPNHAAKFFADALAAQDASAASR